MTPDRTDSPSRWIVPGLRWRRVTPAWLSRRLEFLCLPIDLLQHWRGSAVASGVSSTSPMNGRPTSSPVSAWLVAALAVAESTRRSAPVVVLSTLVLGLLVATVSRAVAGGHVPGRPGGVDPRGGRSCRGHPRGRARRRRPLRRGDRPPPRRSGRTDRPLFARGVAGHGRTGPHPRRPHRARPRGTAGRRPPRRCTGGRPLRVQPTPACPQTHITGCPDPENRTANDFLADSQCELDTAQAGRDRKAPLLDAQIADRQRVIALARQAAIAHAEDGLGARGSAMNEHPRTSPGARALRVLCAAFFALLSLLPLILKSWMPTPPSRSSAPKFARPRKSCGQSRNWPAPGARSRRSTKSIVNSSDARPRSPRSRDARAVRTQGGAGGLTCRAASAGGEPASAAPGGCRRATPGQRHVIDRGASRTSPGPPPAGYVRSCRRSSPRRSRPHQAFARRAPEF